MAKVTSLLFVLFCAWAVHAAREDCFPSEMGASQKNFPDSVSADSIYAITGISPGVCGIAMKKWPHGDNLFVVYSEKEPDFEIHVLQKTNTAFTVIGRLKAELGEYRFKAFDFAAYRIRKNRTAIGIRFFARGPFMGGGWECTRLKLFDFDEGKIRQVLSTLVAYAADGNSVAYDDRSHFSNDESAVILMGKPGAGGYAAIIKKIEKDKIVYTFSETDSAYAAGRETGYKGNLRDGCFCP